MAFLLRSTRHVKAAILLLQVRGVTMDDIRKAYQYYDELKKKAME